MTNADVLARMREDWNERGREDANYYVAFGRREQDEAEFFASAADVVRGLEAELKRIPGARKALEIGCGPGRLMRPLSARFEEIHGVDVSDEMIRLARERLRDVPNAHVARTGGADLELYRDETFDFVYSYAVFQHIPSREVVFAYLREARRVLRPGGILRCQINGLPLTAARYTTWDGVRIAAEEVADYARADGWRLLALEGAGTQYMWVTLRKPAAAVIRNVTNAFSGEAAVPARGRFAAISVWMEKAPPDADLNTLEAWIDGRRGVATYIGCEALTQVNVWLPQGVRTGLVPVEIRDRGATLARAWVRLIPAGVAVPRIVAVSDGVDLMSRKVTSGCVKLAIEEASDADRFEAAIGGAAAEPVESFCTDPAARRFEFNFDLPRGTGPGWHQLQVRLGRRSFPPIPIEVA
jgi:ubiquinone/menaquinone biosynthesis C-methylase UbiE